MSSWLGAVARQVDAENEQKHTQLKEGLQKIEVGGLFLVMRMPDMCRQYHRKAVSWRVSPRSRP